MFLIAFTYLRLKCPDEAFLKYLPQAICLMEFKQAYLNNWKTKISQMLCNGATVIPAMKQVAEVCLRFGSDCNYITVVLSWFVPSGK